MKELNEKDIMRQQADAILDNGIPVTFTADLGNGETKEVKYTLKRLKLGTLLRISKAMLNVDDALLGSNLSIKDIFNALIKYNIEDAIYSIACALTNCKEEPSSEVLDMVKYGMDAEMMAKTMAIISELMDPENFISGITSLTGISILQQVNPTS
jgi:hypothetical protein